MANKTFTFPASQVYIDRAGIRKTITTGETFQLEITDDGTTARYSGVTTGSKIGLADGSTIYLEGDQNVTFMNVTADGSAVTDAGSLWFKEDDNSRTEWHIVSVDLDDADAPTTAEFILERRENSAYTVTWAGMTVA